MFPLEESELLKMKSRGAGWGSEVSADCPWREAELEMVLLLAQKERRFGMLATGKFNCSRYTGCCQWQVESKIVPAWRNRFESCIRLVDLKWKLGITQKHAKVEWEPPTCKPEDSPCFGLRPQQSGIPSGIKS